MKTVAELLREKANHAVVTVSPDSSVFDAVKTMADRSIGAVVVVEGEVVLGMLTERDYARKIVLQDRSSRTTKVRDIMTRSVLCVSEDLGIEEAASMMINKDVEQFPVVSEGKLTGFLSRSDIIRKLFAR